MDQHKAEQSRHDGRECGDNGKVGDCRILQPSKLGNVIDADAKDAHGKYSRPGPAWWQQLFAAPGKHGKQRQGYDSVANADHRYGRHFPDDEFGEHRLNTPDDASTDQKCRGGKLVRLHCSADRPFDDDL